MMLIWVQYLVGKRMNEINGIKFNMLMIPFLQCIQNIIQLVRIRKRLN